MDLEPITVIFDYDEISTPFRLNATIDLSLSLVKRIYIAYLRSQKQIIRLFIYV